MDGMRAGYDARATHERAVQGAAGSQRLHLPPLGRLDFLWMSAVGDLGDLREVLAAPEDQAAGA